MSIHKQLLSEIIKSWLESDSVIIDTETTGLTKESEIVEFSMIDMNGNVLIDTLVRPSQQIPEEVTKINNITNEMVADAPTWSSLYDDIHGILKERKFLAWNAAFDARLITQSCQINCLYEDFPADRLIEMYSDIHDNAIDARQIYSLWYGEKSSKGGFRIQSLARAAEYQQLQFRGAAHRALADCRMVLDVLISTQMEV